MYILLELYLFEHDGATEIRSQYNYFYWLKMNSTKEVLNRFRFAESKSQMVGWHHQQMAIIMSIINGHEFE